MREHATFIGCTASAIAVIVVVPAIWQDNPMAWAISVVLFVAVTISIVMYIAKKRKQSGSSTMEDARPTAGSAIAVEVIGAHDQATVFKNKVRSTVNIYNGQSAVQSVPPENDVDSGGSPQER